MSLLESRKRIMIGAAAWGCMLALAGCLQPHADNACLIRDGQPCADIVIAERPTRAAKLAALELQDHLLKITGARLDIATSPGTNVPTHIYVGRSTHTDRLNITDAGLKHGAFRMVSGKDWLVLLGHDKDFTASPYDPTSRADQSRAIKEWDAHTGEQWELPDGASFTRYSPAVGLWDLDDRGSLNAVYQFLYDQGARWYMPGDLGEVLPARDTIELAPLDKTVIPDFPCRNLGYYSPPFYGGTREAILYRLRIGLDPTMGIPGPHGLNAVNGREEVKKAHPDYFALLPDGRRMTEGPYFASCLSSPGLFESTVKYARTMFDTFPGLRYISVWPNDGFSMCHCDLCKGKDTPERGGLGVASDYVWNFTERVAREVYKTHPDRKIVNGSYGAYALPPTNIVRFSPNVMVGIVQPRKDFADPAIRARALEIRRGFLEKVAPGHLYIYNHYLYTSHGQNGLPVYFPHAIAEDLRSLKGHSQGEFIELSQGPGARDMAAPGFNHLNVYVTARYYWDAGQDVNPLLDEYYRLFYGPAADGMKAFIEYSETNWPSMQSKLEPIDKALSLLESARTAAGDTVYGRRIDQVRDYVQPLKQIRARLAMNRQGVPRTRHIWPVTDAEIEIDGRLDEARWKEGGYGWNTYALSLSELETGRPPFNGTSFRLLWGNRAIYFGLRCNERDMTSLNITTPRNDDAALLEGDCVILFLETQGHSYYQIAVNPAGALYDADRRDGTNTAWSSSARVAVHKGDTFWSVEMRIPVGDAIEGGVDPMKSVEGRTPTSLYPWAFNVCRQRVRSRETERSAWSPTGTHSFDVPMAFGELSDKW